jgi:hypothetical protein
MLRMFEMFINHLLLIISFHHIIIELNQLCYLIIIAIDQLIYVNFTEMYLLVC